MAPKSTTLPRLRGVLFVALGGFLGALLRTQILSWDAQYGPFGLWIGHASGPLSRPSQALLVINLVGVFVAVRLVLGRLAGTGPDSSVRLLLTTGFLGGFTSYSSEVADLWRLWHRSALTGATWTLVVFGAALLTAWCARPRRWTR